MKTVTIAVSDTLWPRHLPATGVMDTHLVVRAQHGDQEAFASIVSAIGGRLHGIAHGILRDRELAEEATQQGIVSIWRDLPKLRDPERFEAWAARVIINACYSEARRAKRWLPDLRDGARDEPSDADAMQAVLDRDELERCLRRLSVDHRTILVLRYYLDYPVERIAQTLDIPPGTAKSRLNRALSALRAALEAHARGEPGSASRSHEEAS